jgi:hypothetical protein
VEPAAALDRSESKGIDATRRPSLVRASVTTPAGAAVSVVVIGAVAALAHIALLAGYHGPWVFDDELGYERLAHSLATTGTLALFGKQGLSYSPLYPLAIAPVYAFHLSSVTAYQAVKFENAVLMAVAVWPIYKIARFVLPRGYAIAATGVSALAPLMLYSNLVMSESLAYPLFLFTVWAMLVSLRSPGWRSDAVVIALFVLCVAVRLQFVVLLPAALVAVALDGLAGPSEGPAWRRAARALKAHRLLTAATLGLAVLVVAAWAGSAVLSLAGRYADQHSLPVPSPWLIAKLFAEHLAGLDFAVGVIPFAGAVLAGYLWLRSPSRSRLSGFAAVSLSATFFLLLVTAVASYGQSYVGGHARKTGDIPRIHERYIFYLVPLFLIALLATTRLPRSPRLIKLGLAAAAVAALLPAVIPYSVVMNHTIAVDSMSLGPLAGSHHGAVAAHSHAILLGVGFALLLALIYAIARPNPALVVASVAALFIWVSSVEQALLDVAARFATRGALPVERNWVDAASPGRSVVLLETPKTTTRSGYADTQTAFYNLSVSHLYYACAALFSSDFGELQARLGAGGVLRDANGRPLRAAYVVAPADGGVAGRIIAQDGPGGLVLLQPPGGPLRVSPGARSVWTCPSPKR